MSLSTLPVELLHRIAHYIPEWPVFGPVTKADLTAIHSIAVSSTYFYNVFKPFLYDSINTVNIDLHLFARSLKEDPSLAALVSDFKITRIRDYDIGKAYHLVKKLDVLPRSCKRHLHPADPKRMDLLLLEGMLAVLRKIKTLTICLDTLDDTCQFFDTKRWKTPPPNLLPHLDQLSIIHTDKSGLSANVSLSPVEHVLAFPREIVIELFSGLVTMPERQLHLPRLEVLHVACESMEPRDVESMIRSCPNLHSFTFYGRPESDWTEFEPPEYISISSMIGILALRLPKLKTLSVHLGDQEDDVEYGFDDTETIPDLHAFTKLKFLDLEYSNLWTEKDVNELAQDLAGEQGLGETYKVEFLDKLPRSLEVLRIFLPDDRGLKEFNALAERKREDFPHFRRLELEMYDDIVGGPDPVPDKLSKTIEHLREAGIEVSLFPGYSMERGV